MPQIGKRWHWLLWGGFALGLAIRLALLSHRSTADMDDWFIPMGRDTFRDSLSVAYRGFYFPVQYLLLELSYWFSTAFSMDPHRGVKLVSLAFDAGNFFLLLVLARRLRFHPGMSLIYWLHPYFFTIFSLGYIDFQFAFFNLAAVVFLSDSKDWKGDLVAGIPIAIAFLMKPQAQALIAALGIFSLVRFLATKKLSVFFTLIPSVILFLAYAAFFALAHRGRFFVATYVYILNAMPCLTAHMPNFWYPIAYAIKAPGAAIWSVSDKITLFARVTMGHVAMALSVLAIALFTVFVRKQNPKQFLKNWPLLLSLTVADFVIPFLMTSAHENHFFSAAVLFIAVLSSVKDKVLHVAFHVILLIQFINLNIIYGDWSRLDAIYSGGVRCAFAVISILMFAAIYFMLLKLFGDRHAPSDLFTRKKIELF